MSLRKRPIEESVKLPDGREAIVKIGIAEDPYIKRSEIDTVSLELLVDGEVAAAINTVLDADERSEALELAREIAAGLESGRLEPTAGSLEPLADQLR